MQQAAGSTSSSKSAAGEPCKRILYKGHNPISPSQRVGLTFISAFSAFADPERADMVAALGETTGHRALKQMHHRMLQDPDGIELLRERPQLDEHSVDLEALGQLPSGTFGKAYADFMAHNQFTPDSRLPVRFVDDADLAYVMARYRQVHDLWHVLSGLPPSLEGEIALKWFEMVQTGLPVAAISALVGAARVPREGRAALRQKLVPWAIRAGRRSVPLMNVWYERYWDMYLSNFREKLKFEPAPQ
ncbi:ubiquinone biosynthesis protein Coq4 [Tribonema minus]|uniref:Ubiquinone biosynthesis protein COQ4 homolog, mitochondrial n=1 Tax=Tribonema minus TaxID=303371 RepID=A0A835Z0M6_9STRA|nr:ubiquinone biosynthesis protein Coq4 [Tribonema minus]